MTLWIVFAILTACVILAVTHPLMHASTAASGSPSDAEAYKLQLAELGREEESGTIAKAEAERMRTEISRRLLRASHRSLAQSMPSASAAFNPAMVFFAFAAAISITAVGIYAKYGANGLSDQPLQARLDAPPQQQTLGIQIANVERRLRANPKDALGWTVLAPVYFQIGQFSKAAKAYRKAMELKGEDENKLLGLFESLTYENDYVIQASAKPLLDAALARNPKSQRGRFWLAALAAQDGRKQEAEQIYREMLSERVSDSWKVFINRQLAELTGGAAGGSQGSGAGSQGDQSAMIRGMVERLAARLKENGADLDGWLRLIRSYAVLKEPDKAEEAAAWARAQFASEPKALEQIDNLVGGLGLAAADTKGTDGVKASGDAVQGDPSAMIRGMVERLANRLKENGADLDGWLRLIRSYAVLKEPAKAQEAVASARTQFASEPKALEQIENLARALGL